MASAMTTAAPINARKIAGAGVFDWAGVRPVYRMFHSEFWRLVTPFGIELSVQLQRDLACVLAAMDAVDRELDSLDESCNRVLFSDSVVEYLAGFGPFKLIPRSASDLEDRLVELREAIVRRKIQFAFANTVGQIFEHSEAKRLARTVIQFQRSIEREWRLTGALPLLVMGDHSNPRFEAFFLYLCEAMPVFDTVLDASRDYREGLMSVRPGLRLYATLAYRFASHIPGLLYRFPSPLTLCRYAFSVLARAKSV